MKKIVLNATAISSGGGFVILESFIIENKSLAEFYVLIDDGIVLDDYLYKLKSVHFISVPKGNWLKRVLWDAYGFNKLINKKFNFKFDGIVNFQNTVVNSNIKQVVYYHQALPFILSPSYSNTLKMNLYIIFYLWFVIIWVKSDTCFVFQTNWLRNKFCEKLKVNKARSFVISPVSTYSPSISGLNHLTKRTKEVVLFYPSSNECYKNVDFVIDVMERLVEQNDDVNYKLYLTLPSHDDITCKVRQKKLSDSVVFTGRLNNVEMKSMYLRTDILLFPSLAESYGLPLVEASSLGISIISNDHPLFVDVLSGYSGVKFISTNNFECWVTEIMKFSPRENEYFVVKEKDNWSNVLNEF